MPTARIRNRSSVNTVRNSASVDGIRPAPARPCTTRAKISSPAEGAIAAAADAAPNARLEISSRRLRPIRSPRLPMVMSSPASTNE